MNLRHLDTFLAIGRLGSFAAAARELNYAQSTITLHVHELQKELGAVLFERAGRRLKLTQAGRILERHAGEISTNVSSLRHSIKELITGNAGEVRLGAIEPGASLRLPAILAEFTQAQPSVKITLEVGGTAFIGDEVAAGRLDFGICSPPKPALDLSFRPLFREDMALLVPSGHPLAASDTVSWEQLDEQPMLLTDDTCAYRQAIEDSLGELGVRLGATIEISSLRAVASAVQSGVGVALAPVSEAAAISGTVVRAIDGADLGLMIGLVRRAGRPVLSAAAESLAALITDRLNE